MNGFIVLCVCIVAAMAADPPAQTGMGELAENRECNDRGFGGCDTTGGVCWFQKDVDGNHVHFCNCKECFSGDKCEIHDDVSYACMRR